MTSDEVTLLQVNDAFYEAFAERDFNKMDDLWARGRAVTCIHPGWSPLVGREAVMASWRAILRSDNPRLEATGSQAFLHGDSAYVLCFEGTDGEPPLLCATNVFVREDGAWRLVHHQAGQLARTPDPTPQGPTN